MNDQNKINESEIPESSQFIAESTLIPATELQIPDSSLLDNGEGQVDPDGLDDSATKNDLAKSEKKKFDIKKNLPIVIGGAIGLIAVAAIGLKMMNQPSVKSIRAPQEQSRSAPIQPEVQNPIQAQPQVQPSAPIVESPLAQNPATQSLPALQPVPESSSVKPASVEPAVVKPVAEMAHDHQKQDHKNGQQDDEINQLKERISRLESLLKSLQESGAKMGDGVKKAAAPDHTASTQKPKQQKAAQSKNRSTAVGSKATDIRNAAGNKNAKAESTRLAAEKKRSEQVEEQRVKAEREEAIDKVAKNFTVAAVKDNLAWLKDRSGKIHSFTLGDDIPGVGKLTIIDEVEHKIKAGDRIIR